MIQDAFWGILIPFLGTSLGAGCVFFLKNALRDGIQRALTGFAAGVMVAASVWSLLIPAMEQAADLGRLAFFPAAVGLDVYKRQACICYCPKEAIEYGKKSRGKPRYHFEALERKQQDV